MPQCSALGCKNRGEEKGVSLHRFPIRKPEVLQQWLHNLGREGFTPNKTSKVCSVHFLPDCFQEDVYAKYGIHPHKKLRMLKPDAVPTELVGQQSPRGKSKRKHPISVASKEKGKRRVKEAKIKVSMPTCWAVGCSNTSACPPYKTVSGELLPLTENVTLHSFPWKTPALLSQWIANVGRNDSMPAKTSRICSVHFLPTCYETDFYAKYMPVSPSRRFRRPKVLKSGSLPTEFCHGQTRTPRQTSNQLLAELLSRGTSGNESSKTSKRSDVNKSVTGPPVKSSAVQVKIEPPETSGCDLYSIIKTEPMIEPIIEYAQFRENVNSREETLQFCGSGDTTLPKTFTVTCVDQSIQVSPADLVRATRSISTQTDFDPSSLIVLDPSRMIVLDPSQVSGLNASQLPGFDPSRITGFNPSQLPGYDPSQEYRAVYVNWKEPISQEPARPDPVEPLNENIPQSSDCDQQALSIQSDSSPQHKLISSSENVMPNVEEVVRFTENIQEVRDQAQEAIELLCNSSYGNHVRLCGFLKTMQKMVDAASNNILKMIKQLADTTKQQQTQFLDLAGFVQKIQREQSQMEGQMLRFRKLNLTMKHSAKRKHKLTPENKKSKFRKKNTSLEISKKVNIKSRKVNRKDYAKEGCSKRHLILVEHHKQLRDLNFKTTMSKDDQKKIKTKSKEKRCRVTSEIRHSKVGRVTVQLTKRNNDHSGTYNGLTIFS